MTKREISQFIIILLLFFIVITLLFNKKINIHMIAERLEHSHVSTTLNVYTHANKKQKKSAKST